MIEKVTIKPYDKRRQTMFLDITKETALWLVGNRVDAEGCTMHQIHVIDQSAVCKRTPQIISLHYGCFEDAD